VTGRGLRPLPDTALSRPVDHVDGKEATGIVWTVAIGVDTHRDVHVAVALDAKRVGMAPDRPPIERELLAEEQPTSRVLAGRR
jgi:hypothetical protein